MNNEFAELLMPFAVRQSGMQSAISAKWNLRNKENFVVSLSQNAAIGEYFPMPTVGSFFYNLIEHWDFFLGRLPMHSKDVSQVCFKARKQPVWPLMSSATPPEDVEYVVPTVKTGIDGYYRCCLESVGWFQPAAGGDKHYGIHLSQGGLVHLANALSVYCPSEDRKVVLAVATQFVYVHLLAHAWIEDLCAMIDFHEGYPLNNGHGRYASTHRRLGSFIVMEELACHVWSMASLYSFLHCPRAVAESRSVPRFSKKALMRAVHQFTMDGPYGHLLPMMPPKGVSGMLISCLRDLLERVYKYPVWESNSAWSALAAMLGVHSVRGFNDPRLMWSSGPVPKRMTTNTALTDFDSYPITLHLD